MTSTIISRALAAAAFALFLVLAAGEALAQEASASLSGRVLDEQSKEPLPGAQVTLIGTSFTTATARDGSYRLAGVPAGAYRARISYLGYGQAEQDLTLAAGGEASVDFDLTLTFSETIEVRESAIDAQARALNQQKTAPNITNVVSADQIGSFPDPNAAEAAQRIPGISIQRDQGEGRYVLIRGTEARLNSMTINGERIPSPEGEIRAVALDVVPADLLQAIEVSKALTPDMDGDAIGGTVNLVTKDAPEERRLQLTLGSGYNKLADSFDQLNGGLTASQRFADGKLGVLVGGSASSLNRASENFEAAYDAGNLINLENRRYDFTRKRYGVTGALDYRASPSSQFGLKGIYNYYDDDEVRQRLRYRMDNSRAIRELRDREELQKIASLVFSGQHFLSRADVDYHLSWSKASEEGPRNYLSTFTQRNVRFAPNVTPTSIDPDNIQANPENENFALYRLDPGFRDQLSDTNDRDVVGALNARWFLTGSGGFSGWLRFGAKYRSKHKTRDNDESSSTIPGTTLFSSVPQNTVESIIDGRYHPGPFQLRDFGRSQIPNLPGVPNPELDAEDFDAHEDLAAGYGMASLQLGQKVQLLGGLRYEHTGIDYTGYQVDFNEDGDYAGTHPLVGDSSYGSLLPSVHLKYAFDEQSNLRVAFTRTLARPNYYDLVPYRIVLEEDSQISTGNSSLRPTTSWNFDVMAERYFTAVGVMSAGFFYKDLADYIYVFSNRQTIGGELFDVTQPLNGEKAHVWGLEFALQNHLTFLPKPLDGLGVYLNYTYTDSEATFPGREGTKATLPGQSRHVGNAALSYEKAGFLGRVSLNFHGKYIDLVGGDASQDRYYDDHVQLDLSASQGIGSKFRIFGELLNLTNEPLRYYRGTPDRPDQEEYYRWWVLFGIKIYL